ncbi:MAG: restriction endonuclease subunit S, partial [Magnetococcales bacterium]|nr:restriction endonuclease subunit S [Magnetococcales bacterium]
GDSGADDGVGAGDYGRPGRAAGDDGMKTFPLAEVCRIDMGQAPKGASYSQDEGIPLIAGAGDFGEWSPKPTKLTTEPSKVSQTGDIILCIRATIGDRNWSDMEYCLGRGVAGLRPKANLDTNYLWHWLDSAKGDLMARGRGATFLQVTKNDLATLPIPLPPLPEQKRIAAILDKADAIRRKRRQALGLADLFLRAVFLDMFGDPVTNPKGLPTTPIKKLGQVVTGNTPSRKQPDYYGDGIEWIKSDNINTPDHFLTPAEEHLTEAGQAVARTVPSGSILVTCIAGSPSCIGNTALADREVAFNQQINAIVPHAGVDPYFLYGQILTGKKLIQGASTNSMKGMVSKGKFQEINVLHPSIEEQKKYRSVFDRHQKLSAILKRQDFDAEDLFSSLTQRAFRGEL